MSSSSSRGRGGNEPWKNVERHYCEVCNVWMGSDKQSILVHENGKKHKEKVQESMQQKRLDRLAQERQGKAVQASIQSIEAQARQALAGDLQLFANVPGGAPLPAAAPVASMYPPPPPPPPPVQSSSAAVPWNNNNQQQQQPNTAVVKQEKSQWESRKQQREEERAQKKRAARGEEDDDDDENDETTKTTKRRKIGVHEGHYSYNSNLKQEEDGDDDGDTTKSSNSRIYLEGQVFGEILEEEMPIQLWTGPITSGAAEKRLPEREFYWKQGLIAALRKRRPPVTSSSSTAATDGEMVTVADVSYLENPEMDTQETLVKSIPLDRIRIVLGDTNDQRIPETLEEARLLAVGGEEEVVVKDKNKKTTVSADAAAAAGLTQEELEEATAMSGWSTVKVKRTTVRHEERQERERERRKRREAAAKEERKEKEALERKMEEAKVANADDSALGAYDVYSSTKREGYKGVHIHDDDASGKQQVQAHELMGTKKLSQGKTNVSFKKKKVVKKRNRRTTSADDDD